MESIKNYWLEGIATRSYFQYNETQGIAHNIRTGKNVPISNDKFHDFLATAKILGFDVGAI